jgi:hypothetical protein
VAVSNDSDMLEPMENRARAASQACGHTESAPDSKPRAAFRILILSSGFASCSENWAIPADADGCAWDVYQACDVVIGAVLISSSRT